MKKRILSILLLSTIMASSCSKEETLPADNFAMGQVISNRSVVGTNQKAMLGCELSVSEHATNVEIKWEDASGITHSQELYEKGISYRTFAWDTPGDYTVKCKVTYFYGSEVKTIEKSYTATVYKTDFRNSFFGDDLKTVLIDNPGLSKENGYIITESPSLLHNFEFNNDYILERGLTIEAKKNTGAPSPKAGYSFFMSEVRKHEKEAIEKQYFVKSNPDFTPTTQQEAVFDKYLKGELLLDDDRIILGLLIDDYSIKLRAFVVNENWEGKLIKTSIMCGADGLNQYRLSTAVTGLNIV